VRKAEIKMFDLTAGWLTQDENGYHFVYDAAYLQNGRGDFFDASSCECYDFFPREKFHA
jgi:hypothetical protein